MIRKQTKITINKANIDDAKRFKILDFIRYTMQNNFTDQDTLKYIKTNLQQQYGGKWQVAMGQKYTAYLPQNLFPCYLDITTKGTTFLIFSRNGSEHKKYIKSKV